MNKCTLYIIPFAVFRRNVSEYILGKVHDSDFMVVDKVGNKTFISYPILIVLTRLIIYQLKIINFNLIEVEFNKKNLLRLEYYGRDLCHLIRH